MLFLTRSWCAKANHHASRALSSNVHFDLEELENQISRVVMVLFALSICALSVESILLDDLDFFELLDDFEDRQFVFSNRI